MRIGIGYDVHAFSKSRKLILGGIIIPFKKGLTGHSDADVLIHSIIDAIIGALGLGDIGKYFPNNDKKYKNISSLELLKYIYGLLKKEKFIIQNIDSVIILENPKINEYIDLMREKISYILKIEKKQINIKATTEEGLGFTGREEGISSHSVVLLERKEL